MKKIFVSDVKECVEDIARAVYTVRNEIDSAYSKLEKIEDAIADLAMLLGELEEESRPKSRLEEIAPKPTKKPTTKECSMTVEDFLDYLMNSGMFGEDP